MQFVQAVKRIAALPLEDTRFAWLGSGLAAKSKAFWTYFPVEDQIQNIPPFTHDAKELSKLITQKKAKGVYLNPNGQVCLAHGTDNMATVLMTMPVPDPNLFWPNTPEMSERSLEPRRAKLLLALAQRAASNDRLRPGLRCVRAQDGMFEAGDEAQYARLWAGTWEGSCLFEATALDKMRVLASDQVVFAMNDSRFMLRSGGECRLIRQVDTFYPDIGWFFANEDSGFYIEFPAKHLVDALKVFKRKEDRRVLRLKTENSALGIHSMTTGGVSSVVLQHPPAMPLDMFVDGERLTTIAKTWPDEEVALRYPTTVTKTSRLRFSTEGFVEYLHPIWRYE